eukprot:SM000077S21631  [mRNA]  locus=s77:587047:587790:- [translate_table: standard]
MGSEVLDLVAAAWAVQAVSCHVFVYSPVSKSGLKRLLKMLVYHSRKDTDFLSAPTEAVAGGAMMVLRQQPTEVNGMQVRWADEVCVAAMLAGGAWGHLHHPKALVCDSVIDACNRHVQLLPIS